MIRWGNDILTSTYLASYGLLTRLASYGRNPLFAGLKAVNDGVWLGVLSPRGRAILNDKYYARQTRYSDDSQNLEGLSTIESEMLQLAFPKTGRVLVAGAGGGREMLCLNRLGFAVDGFDCSRRLVDYGNDFLERHGCPPRISLVEPDATPMTGDRYDAILVGWGVYIHVSPRQKRIEFLKSLRALLRTDGPIVLGFCHRRDDAQSFRVIYRVASTLRRLRRLDPVVMGDKLEPTFEHHFSVDEITKEVEDADMLIQHVDTRNAGQALLAAR